LSTAYALGQFLFALLALLAIRNGVAFMGQWPGLTLGLRAVGQVRKPLPKTAPFPA
jgi:hypothetical protein